MQRGSIVEENSDELRYDTTNLLTKGPHILLNCSIDFYFFLFSWDKGFY